MREGVRVVRAPCLFDSNGFWEGTGRAPIQLETPHPTVKPKTPKLKRNQQPCPSTSKPTPNLEVNLATSKASVETLKVAWSTAKCKVLSLPQPKNHARAFDASESMPASIPPPTTAFWTVLGFWTWFFWGVLEQACRSMAWMWNLVLIQPWVFCLCAPSYRQKSSGHQAACVFNNNGRVPKWGFGRGFELVSIQTAPKRL